jgi:alanine racemase
MAHSHPVWLEIDLGVVERNVRALRLISGTEVMAVVKADAYGYGAVEVARAALRGGAAWLGVARVEEAVALRQAGFDLPILILGMVPHAQIDSCILYNIHLPVGAMETVEVFRRHAAAVGKKLSLHLKVDTGMGRLGVLPGQALALAQLVHAQPLLELAGIFSHLADADWLGDVHTALQIRRFEEALQSLNAHGIRPRWVHLANTAAALRIPQTGCNLVRCGQALVGHNAFSDAPLHAGIQLAMRAWKARLVDCRNRSGEVIGTFSAGFGDGYWRQPGGEVLVGGLRHPLIGLPDFNCMQVKLDRFYPVGTEVVLVGSQGNEIITIQDLARCWGTGPGKITAVIPSHVPRVYL